MPDGDNGSGLIKALGFGAAFWVIIQVLGGGIALSFVSLFTTTAFWIVVGLIFLLWMVRRK